MHAAGRLADTGRSDALVETGTVPMSERSCILTFKPVFVDGETGEDPKHINLTTGAVTNQAGETDAELGLTPAKPVKTFDAARLLGQAKDPNVPGDWAKHEPHKDYFIMVVTGEVYNELYEGARCV